MAAHHETQIKNPGPLTPSAHLNLLFLIFMGIGIGTFGIGLSQASDRVWSSFVLNHFFFLCFALGGIFFAAIHWITGAMWSAPVRRIAESFTAYLPVAFVFFLILSGFGMHSVYHWTHTEYVAKDPILLGKCRLL